MARYMLIMRGTDESIATMMETPFEQMLEEAVGRVDEEMIKAGVLVAAEGLDDPTQGVVVDFSGEKPVVTDGPVRGDQELFGGFYIIDVASKDEAVEWARRLPSMAGSKCEIRRVPTIDEFPQDNEWVIREPGMARADRPALTSAATDGPPSTESARRAVESVWRDRVRRGIVGALARYTGDFALAEDVAQEAVAEALVAWSRDGVPANPVGWLLTAARRRAIDSFRRRSALEERYATLAGQLTEGEASSGVAPRERSDDPPWDPDRVDDDILALMFVACHPVLSPEARVALTLRTVGGLASEAIARAFLVPVPTIQARITRAKKTIAAAGVPFELPPSDDRRERLGGVLSVLYVIFTEGSTATTGDRLLHPDLAYEAIRLARMLAALLPGRAGGARPARPVRAHRRPLSRPHRAPMARRSSWRIRTGASGTGRRSAADWPRWTARRVPGAASDRTGCKRRSPRATPRRPRWRRPTGSASCFSTRRSAGWRRHPLSAQPRRRRVAMANGPRRALSIVDELVASDRLCRVVPPPERARRAAGPARPDRRGAGRVGARRPPVRQRPRTVRAAAQGGCAVVTPHPSRGRGGSSTPAMDLSVPTGTRRGCAPGRRRSSPSRRRRTPPTRTVGR